MNKYLLASLFLVPTLSFASNFSEVFGTRPVIPTVEKMRNNPNLGNIGRLFFKRMYKMISVYTA